MRPSIAVLSSKNLLHNLNIVKKHVAPAKVIAMVKANAYGHGICEVGLRLEPFVDLLGVSSIDEALVLRQGGVKLPIILLQGVFAQDELLLAALEGFHVVIHSHYQFEWLFAMSLPTSLSIWIKINTGLGRLGFTAEEGKKVYRKLLACKNIEHPIRILSHLACAGEKDHPQNLDQIKKFNDFIEDIDSEYSLCNSSALFNFPKCHFNYVRPGIALYGVSSIVGKQGQDFGLKPVMTLHSSLMAVSMRNKGDFIGYSSRYKCPENMPIGIIALGYADGYSMVAQDGCPVNVNGIICPVIGRVSMDMIIIDLRNSPHAKVGDPIVLWGDELPIEDVAKHCLNNSYNMFTNISPRLKCHWVD